MQETTPDDGVPEQQHTAMHGILGDVTEPTADADTDTAEHADTSD